MNWVPLAWIDLKSQSLSILPTLPLAMELLQSTSLLKLRRLRIYQIVVFCVFSHENGSAISLPNDVRKQLKHYSDVCSLIYCLSRKTIWPFFSLFFFSGQHTFWPAKCAPMYDKVIIILVDSGRLRTVK